MFNVIIADNYDQISSEAFRIVKNELRQDQPVLGLATGSSPIGLYKKMIADHNVNGTSYRNVITFNLDEYIGLPREHDQSYWTFMHENLFDQIGLPDINVHMPSGDEADMEKECDRYERDLANYTIGVQILGIGSDGHIGFNEPGTPFDSLTHIARLEESTRRDNARFFEGEIDRVPEEAVTMGLASIMRAKKIVVIAYGKNKTDAVYGMLRGPKDVSCPASILQDHPDVTIILDREAAARIS